MKNTNKIFYYSVLGFVASIMIGCEGGEKDPIESSCDTTDSRVFSGVAVDGYIKEATVCLDIDNNSKCGEFEPTTITNDDGTYSFSIFDINKMTTQSKVIIKGGIDIATNKPFTGLLATADLENNSSVVISPLTTLVSYYTASNSAEDIQRAKEEIANSFDINVSDIDKDPVQQAKDGNEKLLKTAFQIQTLLGVVAASETTYNMTEDEEYDNIVKTLKSITKAVKDTNTTNESNSTRIFDTLLTNMETQELQNVSSIKNTVVSMVSKIDAGFNDINDTNITDALNNTQLDVADMQDNFSLLIKNKLRTDSNDTNISEQIELYTPYLNSITITSDAKDKTPTISKIGDTIIIPENYSPSQSVDIIQVLSSGYSSISGFSLSGIGSEDFTIDNDGILKVKNIDYERKTSYTLEAKVRNMFGRYSESKDINITITNILEVPVLSVSDITINENLEVGEKIATINIDKGDSNITSIELTGIGSGDFALSMDGNITIVNSPDYESRSVYNLQATATNTQGTSTPIDIKISVRNENDAPSIDLPSTIYVDENQNTAFTINATDDDGDALWYSIGGDSNYFNINGNTGEITFKNNPDYETKSSYNLIVYVDSSGKSSQKNITISINNLFDLIAINSSTNTSLYKNTAPLSYSGDSQWTKDGDIYSSGSTDNSYETSCIETTIELEEYTSQFGFDWKVSSGYYDSLKFYVDGLYRTRISGERDWQTYYTYMYAGTHTLKWCYERSWSSDTSGENKGYLKYAFGLPLNIDENIVGGTIDGNVSMGEDITSVSLSGVDSDKFTISLDGVIKLQDNISLDYETKSQYDLVVTASDGTTTLDQNITIGVNDIAEVLTITTDSNIEVDENQNDLITLSHIYGSNPQYSLSGVDASSFDIDSSTGEITFKNAPDYETKSTYNITANISDSLGSTDSKDLNISIRNVFDTITINKVLAPITYSGAANWTKDGDIYSNEDIDNNQISCIEANITSENISFDWKVSSEEGYDYLRFYIDGDEQYGKISGEVDWVTKEYTVDNSSHILKWCYGKDGSASSGTDTGYLKYDFLTKVPLNIDENVDGGVVNGNLVFDGNVTSVTLNDNSKFEIALDGTIKLQDGISVDYNTTSQYDLTVTATDGIISVEQNISIGVNDQ